MSSVGSKTSSVQTNTMSVHDSIAVETDDDIVGRLSERLKSKYRNLTSISRVVGPHLSNIFKAWAEVSQINYYSIRPLEVMRSDSGLRRRSIGMPSQEKSLDFYYDIFNKEDEHDVLFEQFPTNVSTLMNEENKWGCFYMFPEYYADVYSPVVAIRNIEDVPEPVGGVLTRDLITACLTYLRRTPILGDFVYIKLDLSSKGLINIDVLKLYKYLVYLDLSSNRLTQLTVLSNLLYLQYLSVSFNNLTTILEYSPAQWLLTEVHYKYNSVKKINDLSAFWSITILDLSHNNIKWISGLETLKYLRRLDLSFNHIQCLENLNHLRLLWLDLSYNNISTYELGVDRGLWTLLHLEYLNMNENSLTTLKMLSGCTRLRELHLRNNRFGILLEIAVYMKQLRRLVVLDMRANPVCSQPRYKEVIINAFPLLLSLDAKELDPIEQRTLKMNMLPDITVHATRRLLRLLYIQQLSRAVVSPFVPPADTTDVPIIIIVGHEAVGKGTLARRLASDCSSNIELARQHTTALHHYSDHYIEITPYRFDQMLLAGDILTYSELEGESYGLSREEAYSRDGKVKVVTMDLVGAMMMKLRGYRPYLILATMKDTNELARKQAIRRSFRTSQFHHKQRISSVESTFIEHATLQVLLSGRILVTGIINEILMELPEKKEKSEFAFDSDIMDSESRREADSFTRHANVIALLTSSDLSLTDTSKPEQSKQEQSNPNEPSLYSIFKDSPTDEYNSFIAQSSFQSKSSQAYSFGKSSSTSQRRSIDIKKYTSGTYKGSSAMAVDPCKSSKSVTFTDNTDKTEGLLIEPQQTAPKGENFIRSISSKGPWPSPGEHTRPSGRLYNEDSELWLAFLTERRQKQASELNDQISDSGVHPKEDPGDQESVIHQLQPPMAMETHENLESMQTLTTAHIRENYENIHRRTPGLFWDTITMDDPEKAYKKARSIIRDIIKKQNTLKPMFDIDFANISDYPDYEEKLNSIRKEIAPEQLFF